MTKSRLFVPLAAMLCLQVGLAGAQDSTKTAGSLVGRWNGTVETAQGTQQVQLAIDSSATGWKGQALAPAMGPDPTDFSSISVKPDTIMLSLNVGTDVTFSGWINPANHLFEGALFVGGDNAGSFSFARVVPAPAKPAVTPPAKPPRLR